MGKRIKILFSIPNFDTAGSGKVVHDLVKGLDKQLFEPEICCFHSNGEYFKTIEQLGVKIHLFPFAASYRPFISLPLRVLKIYRFFKRNQFDVIHSWHWSSDFTEPLGAKLASIPFIYTKKSMGWGNRSWRWRSKLSAKIIAINADMETQFFSNLLNKVEQIPLGVDTSMFHPTLNFELKREDIDLKESDFVVTTVANLVSIKGIEILIQASKQINNDRVKLLIVGDHNNAYGNALIAEFEDNNVRFIGKQLDVRPYLTISDLFVISTKEKGEGMPIASLEAMASGKIVLGSNVSGIKDILNVFPKLLFKAGNVDDLKSKLVKIINLDQNDRNHLELQLIEHIQSKYSITQFVLKHEELYKSIKL